MYKPSEFNVKSSNKTIVDLRSDAVSHSTQRMRLAMANAIVGDDVFREDETVQELEEKCAKLFEKEAALFVISGIMGNLISIMTHCKVRSAEAIVGASSHVFLFEQGNIIFLFIQFNLIIYSVFADICLLKLFMYILHKSNIWLN